MDMSNKRRGIKHQLPDVYGATGYSWRLPFLNEGEKPIESVFRSAVDLAFLREMD